MIVDHVAGRVVWAEGYIEAVQKYAPQAKIVFDCFHVQRLAWDGVAAVRRAPVRGEAEPRRKRPIQGTGLALCRSQWIRTVEDRAKISDVQRSNRSLYRACLLEAALARPLGCHPAGRAKKALKE